MYVGSREQKGLPQLEVLNDHKDAGWTAFKSFHSTCIHALTYVDVNKTRLHVLTSILVFQAAPPPITLIYVKVKHKIINTVHVLTFTPVLQAAPPPITLIYIKGEKENIMCTHVLTPHLSFRLLPHPSPSST